MTMKPDHGQRGRRREHRRDRTRVALLHVHADVRHSVTAQEIQSLGPVVLAHPGMVAKLDADGYRVAALLAGQQILLPGPADHKPLRELEQDRAKLARVMERPERAEKALPHLIHYGGRHVTHVE